jgi:hypothetical protein
MLPFFGLVDVREMLPPGWSKDIDDVSSLIARDAILKGGTSTSLESADTAIEYRLIDGAGVATHLPWLAKLYRDEFRQIAEQFSRQQLVVDASITSSVNINIIPPGQGGYEWHVDSNPVTGLLFLSSHLHEDGGMLELRTADEHLLSIEPLAGTFAVFDARLCPHRVSAPIKGLRISAPMNYFVGSQGRHRPDDLDNTLYGEQA